MFHFGVCFWQGKLNQVEVFSLTHFHRKMSVEAKVANQEYLITWENPKDINYKWFELKGNFETGSFASQKNKSFFYTPLEITKS